MKQPPHPPPCHPEPKAKDLAQKGSGTAGHMSRLVWRPCRGAQDKRLAGERIATPACALVRNDRLGGAVHVEGVPRFRKARGGGKPPPYGTGQPVHPVPPPAAAHPAPDSFANTAPALCNSSILTEKVPDNLFAFPINPPPFSGQSPAYPRKNILSQLCYVFSRLSKPVGIR